MSEAAERYARVADRFGDRVRAVGDRWDRPTPCEGWVTRDVVDHLAGWVPGMLAGSAPIDRPDLPSGDSGGSDRIDPVAVWAALDRWLRSLLADPARAGLAFDGPLGPMDLATAIDRFVTTDVLIHTWDLARAVGLDDRFEPDEIDGMLEGMEPHDEALRQSGHYGPRVPVTDDADDQDRLLAFLGRDPDWAPPT